MKYRYFLIFLLLLPFVVAMGAHASFTGEVTKAPMIIDYGPDYSDNRVLIGDDTNVFVGKVLAETGTVPPESGNPNSKTSYLFSAKVLFNIKGYASGVITLRQFDSGQPFVQVGSTYAFAANYWTQNDWYGLVYYPYQYEVITDDHNLNYFELTALALANKHVRDLAAACPFQDTPPRGVRGGCNLLLSSSLGAPVLTAISVALLILCAVWWRRRAAKLPVTPRPL